MCGIAGIALRTPARRSAELNLLSKRLAHRGPHDDGWMLLTPEGPVSGRGDAPDQPSRVGLVHRRLSILDLSKRGWQPMASACGRWWIVYNGEIYNFVELARDLKRLGHTFRSRSDTEVLLAAWREWGPMCLDRLVGMFAFAMVDVDLQRLFIARDKFGIKPLFFASWEGGFSFSSEIPPLLDLPQITTTADAQGVFEYARYGFTDHREGTLFRDIKQLPPASYCEISLLDPRPQTPQRYWKLRRVSPIDVGFDDAADRVRELFLDSVRIHLRSDVPIGMLLSGGIDSSAVLAGMRRLEPAMTINAFSYIADDESISEERWVDLMSAKCGVEVTKVEATATGLLNELDSLVRVQGEPFGSTSLYAGYRVSNAVQDQGIRVVLDGQGADEIFAGYPVYAAARLASLLKQGDALQAVTFGSALRRRPGGWPIILRSAMFLLPSRVQALVRPLIRRGFVQPWMSAEWVAKNAVAPLPPRSKYGRNVLRDELIDALERLHLPSLLRYEDRSSMAFGVETRLPFLTAPLAEFALSLPENYLIDSHGTTKAVFRAAMRGIVPDSILDRQDKIGFATPEQLWLQSRSQWVDDWLADARIERVPILESVGLRAEWDAVRRGRRRFDFSIWRSVNLIAWTEAFNVAHT